MLTNNRQYHYVGEFILKRSRQLLEDIQPYDDIVNWLFLDTEGHQFSFVYKIDNNSEVKYGQPFKAQCAFTMVDLVRDTVKLNQTYKVLRGSEVIGNVKLITII